MAIPPGQTVIATTHRYGVVKMLSGSGIMTDSDGQVVFDVPNAQSVLGVGQGGSTGTDYSANAATVPLSGYVLLTTIPASSSRAYIEVQNQSAGTIQVVRDDGLGANQTTILLAPGSGTGQQGGGWSSGTFKGRIRVYGVTGAQVAAYQD